MLPEHAAIVVREIRSFMDERGMKQPEMAEKLGISQPSLSAFVSPGATGRPSYNTAYKFAEIAELDEGFWHKKAVSYPDYVIDTVEALQREFAGLSTLVAARLVDAIAKAGNLTWPAELANLARPVLRARSRGIEKDLVTDELTPNRAADGDNPASQKTSARAVIKRQSSRPPNDSVHRPQRARKKAP